MSADRVGPIHMDSRSIEASYEQERQVARLVAPLYDAAYESPYWESERAAFAGAIAAYTRSRGLDPARSTVLEIGTGTGLLIPHLREVGFRTIVGNDISEDMLDRAAARFPDVEFHVGPIEAQSSLPAPFDVVVGFSVLHHLPDLRTFFQWLETALAPRGVFAFADGNAASIVAHSRWRWFIWALVYPLHKPMRLMNRDALQKMPSMEGDEYYSDVHRALTRQEVVEALPRALEAEFRTHGVIAPTFNNAIIGSPFERRLLRGFRALDRMLPLEGEELWTFGTARDVPRAA